MSGWHLLRNWLHLGWQLWTNVERRTALHVSMLHRGCFLDARILKAVHYVRHAHLVVDLRTLIIILLYVDAHDDADDLAGSRLLLRSPVPRCGSKVFGTFVLIGEAVEIVELFRLGHQLRLHGIGL